ncbi:MAG: ZIP family metal transporter [Elusimicrobiota bacterium]|jgi:ZIP family zinc transporter/zinc and cadmium transporter
MNLFLFNVGAAAMTLLGGLVPSIRSALSRPAVERMFSLRSGILLGVALVGVLPEAARTDETFAGWGALIAFCALFLMEHCASPDTCCEFVEDCRSHVLGTGALAALCLHAFLDGLNLTSAFEAGAAMGAAGGVALLIHKLADGFTLTSLLLQGGYSRMAVLGALGAATLATPLGSALSFAGFNALPPTLVGGLLGLSGGSLLYVGASGAFSRSHQQRDCLGLLLFIAGAALMAVLRGAL